MPIYYKAAAIWQSLVDGQEIDKVKAPKIEKIDKTFGDVVIRIYAYSFLHFSLKRSLEWSKDLTSFKCEIVSLLVSLNSFIYIYIYIPIYPL